MSTEIVFAILIVVGAVALYCLISVFRELKALEGLSDE